MHNEHVKIKYNEPSLNIRRKTEYEERTILSYNQKNFYAYDGDKKFYISKQLLLDIYEYKKKCIIIFKYNNKMSFDDEYRTIINIFNRLKTYSRNEINLYKPDNYTNMALEILINKKYIIY